MNTVLQPKHHVAFCNNNCRNKAEMRSQNGKQTSVQPKMELTTPGDVYEQEADRMADFVMQKSSSGLGSEQPSTISIFPPTISRNSNSNSGVAIGASTESTINASRGSGQPMPIALLSQMESGFGQDFSAVRLHTGSNASQMNSDIGAKAFTYGNDIYFNSGQYQPHSHQGQRLLAHELTHVVQQNGKVGRQEEPGKGSFIAGISLANTLFGVYLNIYRHTGPDVKDVDLDFKTKNYPILMRIIDGLIDLDEDGIVKTLKKDGFDIKNTNYILKNPQNRKEAENFTWEWLRYKGFTPQQAAAIMGNWLHESNFDPTRIECTGRDAKSYGVWNETKDEASKKKLKDIYPNSSKLAQPEAFAGGGIGQWTGNRAADLNTFVMGGTHRKTTENQIAISKKLNRANITISKSLNFTDPQQIRYLLPIQLAFAWKENRGGIFRTNSPKWGNADYVGIFMNLFEGLPLNHDSLKKREMYFNKYLDDYKKLQLVEQNNLDISPVVNNASKNNQDDEIINNYCSLEDLAKLNRGQRARYLFGDNAIKAKGGKIIYETYNDAKANIKEIKVKAWKENESGEKVPYEFKLKVHEKLASLLEKIFEEIYYHVDKFVILDAEMDIRIAPDDQKERSRKNGEKFSASPAAAFNWRYARYKVGDSRLTKFSEHAAGVAIDINSRYNPHINGENPYVIKQYEGKYNKYTIRAGSSTVGIFKKYGWSWGGEWSGRKDYMHFEWFSKTFPKE